LAEILGGRSDVWHICTAVANETLIVETLAEEKRVRVRVDLQAWFDSGLLLSCQPDGAEEAAAFVRYAAVLDDGEAMCLALAKCRSWMIATDERKGRRIALRDGISTINTVELIRSWAEATSVDPDILKEVVTNIAVLGRYRPMPDAPGADWWRSNGGGMGG
jgi:predicted nucleic acid-binding protein